MEKTKSNVKSLLDKEERGLVEALKGARAAAAEIFKTSRPTVEMVAGTYERAFTFEDEADIELSVRQLAECVNIAADVFEEEASPVNVEQVFFCYDVIFESDDE